MAVDSMTPRSRRALLTAAAGAAGALAAQAALPLTAAAAPSGMMTEQDNPTVATTSITDSGTDSTAFASHATGTGSGYGVEATSTGGGGLVGWSVSPPDAGWFLPAHTKYTGVFGSAPESLEEGYAGTGVWGDSPDTGVYGSGSWGVVGYGGVGVEGDANDAAGSIGVWAWARTNAQVALKVTGKVSLSRSGRKSMRSGTASKTIYLAGVTTSSKVFAILASSESGRWVRAAVPAAGKFTVYLNTKLSSSAVVSWFVLD
jgi:hypothetical protein